MNHFGPLWTLNISILEGLFKHCIDSRTNSRTYTLLMNIEKPLGPFFARKKNLCVNVYLL
jgi:hypothetical protein